jgi:hypothetical protein
MVGSADCQISLYGNTDNQIDRTTKGNSEKIHHEKKNAKYF